MKIWNRLGFKPEMRHQCLQSLISAALLFICIQNSGCEIPGLESTDSKIERLKQLVSENDFESAHKLLDSAKIGVSSDDAYLIEYNEAVLAILEGKCEEAEEILQKHTHSSINAGDLMPQLHSAPNDSFHAFYHYATAIARICPTRAIKETDNPPYAEALKDLYLAFSNGLDVREQIKTVLKFMIPDCTTFIPENQKSASSPENAMALKSNDELEFVLCSDGIWLKHHLRAHEKITATLHLQPLDRKDWMDDSSKLPFIQLHADLLEAPENEKTFSPPVTTYVHPLPTIPPSDADYQRLSIVLPEATPKHDGTYLVHIYPQNHGEANVKFSFNKHLDCDYIDDQLTYSDDLKQHVVELSDGDNYGELTLCPTRPDAFSFKLQPGQKALFNLMTASRGEIQPGLSIRVQDENKRLLKPVETDDENSTDAEMIHFKYQPNAPDEKFVFGTPEFVLVQNITQTPHQYRLELENTVLGSVSNYRLNFAESTDCANAQNPQIIPIALSDIDKERVIYDTAKWVCPAHTLVYQPKLASQDTILRSRINMTFVSHQIIGADQISLESLMFMNNDGKKYPVEKAENVDTYLTPDTHAAAGSLLKPLISNTIIQETTAPTISGFSILQVELSDNDQQEEEDSENSNDEDKKEDKKDQRDKVNKQDTPNKSPDKPSESPTSARGAGDDTQGDESKPDENASGNKASAFDINQYEKDHIDALMDEIERGLFYVPLQGNLKEKTNDKDW